MQSKLSEGLQVLKALFYRSRLRLTNFGNWRQIIANFYHLTLVVEVDAAVVHTKRDGARRSISSRFRPGRVRSRRKRVGLGRATTAADTLPDPEGFPDVPDQWPEHEQGQFIPIGSALVGTWPSGRESGLWTPGNRGSRTDPARIRRAARVGEVGLRPSHAPI